MYKYELVKLLEKVLYPSYEMKGGEHAFHCPFCNHHKKKLQVNFETQKWHCWVCNAGGHKIGILLRKINAPKQIISAVLKILGDYKVHNINPMTARKNVFGVARVKGIKAKDLVKMKKRNTMFHYLNVINHFGNHQLTHCIEMR